MKAKYQGELDGLCGPYAIVNAFEKAGVSGCTEKLFQVACGAASPRRWPKILWEGTDFEDLKRMALSCNESLAAKKRLTITFPFEKRPPSSNEAYWRRFDEIFEDPGVTCGIIGMNKPSDHWIVVRHDGGRVRFTDSTAGRPNVRKNRSSIFAGLRRKKSSQWRIDRSELVVFAKRT